MHFAGNVSRKACLLVIIGALFMLGLNQALLPKSHAASGTRYTMTAFTNSSESNMYVYQSGDAQNYWLVKGSAYTPPSGLVRDPSIMRHTDGKYYVVYTTNWTGNTIGIASSTDRINWTFIRNVTVPVTGGVNTWAPEWFKDTDGTVNIIVSVSTSSYTDFNGYVMTAQNADLSSWSAPKKMSGLGPNYIDTFVVKVGGTYHAFTKNETTKYIEHATATSLTGPYTFQDTGDWAGWGNWLEGPCLTQLDNGTWRIYFDGYSAGKYYYSDSTDLLHWSAKTEIPGGLSGFVRHMTVLKETAVSSYFRIYNPSTGLYIDGMGLTSNGSNAGQWGNSNSYNQQWTIENDGNYVRIKNRATGLYLDGMGRTSNGSATGQWGDSNSYNQQWTIEDDGNNIRFKNRATGLYPDGMGRAANGSDLGQWGNSNSTNQQWQFVAAN